MKILFDQGTPALLRRTLASHQVSTGFEMEWDRLDNRKLLAEAEKAFDAFITTDKDIRYQQNLARGRLAILVLPTTIWPEIRNHLGCVSDAVNALKPGDFIDVKF